MADITVNDIDVVGNESDLLLPQIGNWSAHLELDTDIPPSGQVTLTVFGVDFKGTVLRTGEQDTFVNVLIVGGKGGLSTEIKPKMYSNQIQLKLLINDLLKEAGETLDDSSDIAVLSKTVPKWVRLKGQASHLLSQIVEEADAFWRVTKAGTIWIGKDPYTTVADFDYELMQTSGSMNMDVVWLNDCVLFPGLMFNDKMIGFVEYRFKQDGMYAQVYYRSDKTMVTHPVRAGLEALIRDVTNGVDYLGSYLGEVVVQRSDGSLDIRFGEGSRLPGPTEVPYDVTPPGAVLKVAQGTSVSVYFDAGEPSRPRARLFGSGGGTKQVARKGDSVQVKVYFNPGMGGAQLAPVAGPGLTEIALTGEVTSGSEDFKIP
jgi:hypothetical protein